MRVPVPADWSQQPKKAVKEWERSPDKLGRLYDELFDSFVLTETVESWEDFCSWSNELQDWGFRGQREALWTLQTSLEFMVRVSHKSGHYHLNRQVEGHELFLRFQQQASEYIPNLPADDDLASWLALMQHYGVPTRLLDWAESPNVALYFAIEEAPRGVNTKSSTKKTKLADGESNVEGNCSALWAIDLDWLERRGRESLGLAQEIPTQNDSKARIQFLNSLLNQREKPLILRIDPLKDNPRMVAQRGFFLWKLFEETPFFDQILMTMMIHPEIPERPVIRKLLVPDELRTKFLEKLRGVDIQHASLFPGEGFDTQALEAFCHSLKLDLQKKVRREVDKANRERREWLLERAAYASI
jgi:hypothetical protein